MVEIDMLSVCRMELELIPVYSTAEIESVAVRVVEIDLISV